MKKKNRADKKRLGVYAKTALSFLVRAAATGIVFAFSGLDAMAEGFTYYNRYSKSYIGRRRSYDKKSMRQTLIRLKARGYIRVVAQGDEAFLRITAEGKRAVEKLRMAELKIVKSRTWNRTWNLVAFDIPEEKKVAREAFRRRLMGLGFTKLEKSLLVIPYPCEKEIAFLAKYFVIGPYVHYITATSFNGDHRLKVAYGLV